jgi:Kdo2-lipid IVA lauroyltransferase/acyltransferase
MTVLAWLLARCGRPTRNILGDCLAFLAFSVLRIRRTHVLTALRTLRAVRTESTDSTTALPQLAFECYRNWGRSVCDLLWASKKRDPTLLARLSSESEALLRTVSGPFVVAAAHTGNWEAALIGLGATLKFKALVRRQGRGIASWLVALRRQYDVDVLFDDEKRSRASLRTDRTLVTAIDQAPTADELRTMAATNGPHGLSWTLDTFLGEPAHCSIHAAKLACLLQRPLLTVMSRRDVTGLEHVTIVRVAVPPKPDEPRLAWCHAEARASQRLLEEHIRKHPTQWLWLHRRWKR